MLQNVQNGCEAVDAFSQDWGHDNNWIYPPVCLLMRVLKHMELCKARGTVILPLWKSSCFWTLFCNDGVHWNSFVVDWVFLPKFPGLFIRGKARNTLFRSWGPFLEGPEKFSHPESHSKISKLMITELFYSRIFNINRGSLHTRSFKRIHFSVFRHR